MRTYPVDVDPKQIVRWLIAEHRRAPTALKIAARRAIEAREIPMQREFRLGDEEREDLSEVAITATLEVAPAHASDGWLLKIVVEDESGPRMPDRAAEAEPEQQIDLGAFYSEFIRPGRGTATAVAEAENAAAEARLGRLLDAISVDRHVGESAA